MGDQERLKGLLVAGDEDFFLKASSNPNATYSVLWYALPTHPLARYQRACKVDILLPGIMDIPVIPRERITWIQQLPLMPLMPLLMMKLQGWSDHRESPRQDFQEKVPVDVEDILELLDLAYEDPSCHLSQVEWLSDEFINNAYFRIRDFVDYESLDSVWQWRALGFDT